MFVTIIYIISTVAWALVTFDLIRLTITTKKNGDNFPSLLVPLLVVAISVLLESAYFGLGSALYYYGNSSFFTNVILAQNNWFIVKFIMAFSGILFLYELRRKK